MQSNNLTLCVLLLLHNTEFNHRGFKNGLCQISAKKDFIPDDNVGSLESFGKLCVNGSVILINNGKELDIAHTVMETNLEAKDFCEDRLFDIEPQDALHEISFKTINFNNDLTISDSKKLDILSE